MHNVFRFMNYYLTLTLSSKTGWCHSYCSYKLYQAQPMLMFAAWDIISTLRQHYSLRTHWGLKKMAKHCPLHPCFPCDPHHHPPLQLLELRLQNRLNKNQIVMQRLHLSSTLYHILQIEVAPELLTWFCLPHDLFMQEIALFLKTTYYFFLPLDLGFQELHFGDQSLKT